MVQWLSEKGFMFTYFHCQESRAGGSEWKQIDLNTIIYKYIYTRFNISFGLFITSSEESWWIGIYKKCWSLSGKILPVTTDKKQTIPNTWYFKHTAYWVYIIYKVNKETTTHVIESKVYTQIRSLVKESQMNRCTPTARYSQLFFSQCFCFIRT